MRDSRATKQQASGQWLAILDDLAPALQPALDKVGDHVPCPIGSGSTDGFRVYRDVNQTGGGVSNSFGSFTDGFNLLMWVNNWSFPEAHDAVFEWLNGATVREPIKQVTYSKADDNSGADKAKRRRYLLNLLWTQSQGIDSTGAEPATTYLARRRCYPLPWDMPDLAFHESLQYKDDSGVQNFPGLLAVVRDRNGKGVTMHRTFLTLDGNKAPVEKPKRMMPIPPDAMVTGSAIRLQPAGWQGEVIGVAEGIETALCVSCATHMVCWSVMSSTFLATFEPPPWVKKVVIWADCDREKLMRRSGKLIDAGSAGQKAAHGLQNRLWEIGIESEIRLPPPVPETLTQKSVDWADIYAMYGSKSFFNNDSRRWG